MHNLLKKLTLTLALLLAADTFANTTDDIDQKLFAQANAAYDSGDFQQAVTLYNQILDDGFASWQLYYNLGNAHYRLEQIGYAILNYKRALRIAPNRQIIKDNLQLASSKTVDNIEQLPPMFLVGWAHSIARITTPHGWRISLIVLLTISAAIVCVFCIAKDYKIRKLSFIALLISIFLTFLTVFFAAFSAKTVTNNNEAVVIEPLIVVKGSPDAKSVDKFVLHEGTVLNIDDQQDDWWQITIADGKSGWINNGAEKI